MGSGLWKEVATIIVSFEPLVRNELQMKVRERNEFIDVLKGISIWFVVWGHVIQKGYVDATDFFENTVFRFIYGFHMPLFAIISGYLFYTTCQKRSFLQVLFRRLKSYGCPIIVWGLADWAITITRKANQYSLYECARTMYHSFVGLWFFWTILICSLLVAIVYYSPLLGGVGKILGYLSGFAILLFFWTPCRDMNIWLFFYFLLGFLVNQYNLNVKRGTYILATMYIPLLSFFHRDMYIYISGIIPWQSSFGFWTQIRIDAYRWILGFTGIGFVVVFMKYAVEIPFLHIVVCGLKEIGSYTLQIYILQRWLIDQWGGKIYKELFSNYISITQNTVIYNYLVTPLIALISLFLIYVLILVIRKHEKINQILFAR